MTPRTRNAADEAAEAYARGHAEAERVEEPVPPVDTFRDLLTPPDPLETLTPPNGQQKVDEGGTVGYNHTLASGSDGHRCIAVIDMPPYLTPIEAARVGRELVEVAEIAANQLVIKGSRSVPVPDPGPMTMG